MNAIALGLGPIEGQFWHIAFLMTRVGAALVAAPIFGAMGVPAMVRVSAAGALAIFVALWLPVPEVSLTFTLAGLIAVLGEVLIGLSLGFVLQLAFSAPLVAAELIGGGMGLSMALSASPDGQGQRSVFGNFLTIALTLIFFGTGGHLIWLRLLMESYTVFPPGAAWLGADRYLAIAQYGATTFASGLAIALPITVILLLVQLATGVLSRSAPALNLFALGLPLGVLAGIGGLIIAAPLMFANLGDLSLNALQASKELIAR